MLSLLGLPGLENCIYECVSRDNGLGARVSLCLALTSSCSAHLCCHRL